MLGSARIRSAVVVAIWLTFGSFGPAEAQSGPVRILPLGDSITESYTGYASYRYYLWNDLEALGHSVDFVGSMSGVFSGPPAFLDFDLDHEGHWGWRADEILGQIATWATAAQPDIVLMHLGHNDIWQGQSIASTIDELGQIVAAIRVVNPNVTVLLAQVIPAAPGIGLDSIPALNAEIALLAASLDSAMSPVVLVDQWTGFDPVADTWDGVHPDETGEPKMADRWLESLLPLLPPLGSEFLRGDCNDDGGRDISDAIATLAVLFSGTISLCPDACDANDDGTFDIADAVSSLDHLFAGGPAPAPPFAACGADPTPDPLECPSFDGCP